MEARSNLLPPIKDDRPMSRKNTELLGETPSLDLHPQDYSALETFFRQTLKNFTKQLPIHSHDSCKQLLNNQLIQMLEEAASEKFTLSDILPYLEENFFSSPTISDNTKYELMHQLLTPPCSLLYRHQSAAHTHLTHFVNQKPKKGKRQSLVDLSNNAEKNEQQLNFFSHIVIKRLGLAPITITSSAMCHYKPLHHQPSGDFKFLPFWKR